MLAKAKPQGPKPCSILGLIAGIEEVVVKLERRLGMGRKTSLRG
jgi:hypothetical protein